MHGSTGVPHVEILILFVSARNLGHRPASAGHSRYRVWWRGRSWAGVCNRHWRRWRRSVSCGCDRHWWGRWPGNCVGDGKSHRLRRRRACRGAYISTGSRMPVRPGAASGQRISPGEEAKARAGKQSGQGNEHVEVTMRPSPECKRV